VEIDFLEEESNLDFFFRHPLGRGKAVKKIDWRITIQLRKFDFWKNSDFFFILTPEKVEGVDGNERKNQFLSPP